MSLVTNQLLMMKTDNLKNVEFYSISV